MTNIPDVRIPSGSLLIGDGRIDRTSAGDIEQLDPSRGTPLAAITLAGPDEIDAAVRAAKTAEPAWRSMAPNRRRDLIMAFADALDAHHEELSILRSLELGAPKKQGKGLNMAVEYMRYFAGWVDKLEGTTIPLGSGVLNYTVPEPYGTIAALTPWNGGVVSAAMKVVPALVAGNCVVLKPSELAALAPLRFGELALEAGLAPGVLNVVPGGVAAGEALVAHPGVGKISFTGGTVTARRVLAGAATNLTPVILELGGKSANVVFADADLDAAVATTISVALAGMSGQGCVLPTRVLIQDSVYDEVEQRVVAAAAALVVGRPFEPGVQAGPVISAQSLDRILGMIERARDRGDGELKTGGHRLLGDLSSGFFVAPTVFGSVDNASPIAQEEVFGPVISLVRFTDEADAIRLANESVYGLGGLVFTNDIGRAHRVAHQLDVGSVGVNAFAPMPPSAPFGGVKQSGFGREGGLVGVREFLRDKNVYVGLGAPR
ncbi:MAG TPA: aldehyde dehydrogenase family protein [Ilumatobacteraceae bacterium]|nr:aldehyde dehydrogenase family protein [Ilumatobacteraceae bacterium]